MDFIDCYYSILLRSNNRGKGLKLCKRYVWLIVKFLK